MSNESKLTKPITPDKVSKAKMASYGMGPFIQSFMMTAYNVLIFYYYQVELGLATALVGISFVIYAVWNMINDPLMGYLTDKPNRWSQKYGLRVPWIVIAGILQAILWFFMFFIPFDVSDVNSNPWPLFWYMIIITCLWDTVFSLFSVHMVGGFANLFRTPEDRRKGSTMAMVIGIFGRTLAQGIVVPFIIILGDPSSYVRAALMCTIILIICLILLIPGVYENEFVKKRYLKIYEYLEKQKMGYFKSLKIAFKQKNFRLWVVVYTLNITANAIRQVSFIYFYVEVLGLDVSAFALTTLVFLIAFFPGLFIWSWVAKKTAHSNVSTIALFGFACISLIIFFFVTELTGLLIANVIMGFLAGAWTCVIFSMAADTNDEVTNAAGRHVEAMLTGIKNFCFRVAFLVVGVVIAGVQIATGYQPGAAQQTELAQWGIRIHAQLIPALLYLGGAILMLKFYDLKGEKKIAQLESLRKQGL